VVDANDADTQLSTSACTLMYTSMYICTNRAYMKGTVVNEHSLHTAEIMHTHTDKNSTVLYYRLFASFVRVIN